MKNLMDMIQRQGTKFIEGLANVLDCGAEYEIGLECRNVSETKV